MKLQNNIAAFGWLFSLCFLAICMAFTYVLIRDGASDIQIYPPDIPGYYPAWFMPLVLAVFWLAGLAAAGHLARIPCVRVEVLADKSVSVVRRYPFRKETRLFPAARLLPAKLVASTGSDGDPYFSVQIADVDGLTATIAEGSDREHCAAVSARFNATIGKA